MIYQRNKSTTRRIIITKIWTGAILLVLLFWFLLILAKVNGDTEVKGVNKDAKLIETINNQPQFQDTSRTDCVKQVLVFHAANSDTNWKAVVDEQEQQRHHSLKAITDHCSWDIKEVHLSNFGMIMKNQGFQYALDQSDSQIQDALNLYGPDALLFMSKGVGIATYLSTNQTYNSLPLILLSPIPNECNHIDSDGTWESEWYSTMDILKNTNKDTPIVMGIGNSKDELEFIALEIAKTKICGKLSKQKNIGTNVDGTNDDEIWIFDGCPMWRLYVFPGNHSWKNDIENTKNIALLIDKAFEMHAVQLQQQLVVKRHSREQHTSKNVLDST